MVSARFKRTDIFSKEYMKTCQYFTTRIPEQELESLDYKRYPIQKQHVIKNSYLL